MDRDITRRLLSELEKLTRATERSAVAQEQLIVLATEERDSIASQVDPMICPHCGYANPDIRSEGGEGPLSEFALVATCQECNKTFAALPRGWHLYLNANEAADALAKGGSNDNGS